MRKTLAGLMVGALALVGLATAPVGASETKAPAKSVQITLVHGIPGANDFPVDIYVRGVFARKTTVFEDVKFKTVAPVNVSPDLYLVSIRGANASPTSRPVLQGLVFGFPRTSQSVVAHLSANGTPRVSTYFNDLRSAGAGNGRVTVRHNAQAPGVDIIANGSLVLFNNLRNNQSRSADVPAATYQVKVAADADNSVVAFEGPVTLGAGKHVIVYAVGKFDAHPSMNTFTPLVQVLDLRP